jgi:alcohol dehydrogenase (cytochrome c)
MTADRKAAWITLAGAAIGAVAAIAAAAATQQSPAAPPAAPAVIEPTPAVLRDYPPVTLARLRAPGDGEWLMNRRTYDGWGYSPLSQITTSNVATLQPAWIASTGALNGHEAAAVVNGGVMFVATPGNQVMALDVRTGTTLWRYRRPLAPTVIARHPTTRGVALYGDSVFLAANDAVLVALDARTGRIRWTATVAENKNGYYMSLAPLVADGKILVGTSGGELGVRGFLAAYDPASGKQLWKTYTVPAPGERGSETWPRGDQWKTGGGPIWVTANYDPETNLTFWGTGNGGPWMGDQRPGDNLYVASTIAVDAATGEIKGHFQYTPNESWDWDEVSPPILVDYVRNGRTIKGLVDVARNGYLWFLERSAGPIRFVGATPHVKQNVFRGIDPVTGRPDVDPARKPGTGRTVEFCPSHWGGKNWPPIAFSPDTRLIYVPANENLCAGLEGLPVKYVAGSSFTGGRITGLTFAPGAEHIGEVQAWNVDTGQRAWTEPLGWQSNWGPLLATAGGLVFGGGTADRKFRAFDARTGKVLWEVATNSGVIGQPSTFSIDGRQYIAVQSGWGIDARAMQTRLNTARPGEYPEVPEGGAIWVFALPDSGSR